VRNLMDCGGRIIPNRTVFQGGFNHFSYSILVFPKRGKILGDIRKISLSNRPEFFIFTWDTSMYVTVPELLFNLTYQAIQ
jgi:hypothetical protein